MLNLTIQSLDGIKDDIQSYVELRGRGGSNALLHGTFGHIRKMDKYKFFGDYPLLYSTLVVLKKIEMPPTKRKLLSCVNKRCTELHGKFYGKKAIIRQLYQAL